jgi:hypothetical protein
MAKRHQALKQDRPRFEVAYPKVLATTTGVFGKHGETRTSRWASGSPFTRTGSDLELKHVVTGKIELPWGVFVHLHNGLAASAFTGAAGVGRPCLRLFATCVTGLRPALLLGDRGWKALPTGYEEGAAYGLRGL